MSGYLQLRRDLRAAIAPTPLPGGIVLADLNIELARHCRALMDRAYAPAGYAPVPFESWYAALIGDGEYDPALVWVAMDGSAVAGFCQCWREPFVKDLVVDTAWRRRGLGAALLTGALEAFAERGAATVDLKTDIDNVKAQSLYRRLGFTLVERVNG